MSYIYTKFISVQTKKNLHYVLVVSNDIHTFLVHSVCLALIAIEISNEVTYFMLFTMSIFHILSSQYYVLYKIYESVCGILRV